MITHVHKPLVSYHLSRGQQLLSRLAVIAHRAQQILTSRQFLVGGGITLGVMGAGYLAFSLWPRTVQFSYSEPTCFTNPAAFPRLISKKTSESYRAAPSTSFAIADYPVYSHKTCVTPTNAPKAQMVENLTYGNAVFKKTVRVQSGALPALKDQHPLDKPIPTHAPITFQLDKHDRVFDYRLTAGDNKLVCDVASQAVVCDVAVLKLAQSAQYKLTLERVFNGQAAGALLQQVITTVEAAQITGSSISANQIVYDVPTGVSLTINKPAASIKGTRLELVAGETRKTIATTTKLDGNTLAISFKDALPRNSSFELIVDEIVAADGGYLIAPYVLPFKTSGGPKVLSVNIGSSKVQPSASIVITFDSPVSASQSLGDFIKLEIGGVASSISVSGNKVTIKPGTPMPRCAAFTVKVLDGLKNNFGISGGSAWSFKSRVLCQTVFSIGASVQGRSITAYRFGTGGSKIIFVGGTHGDEKSSVYLLNSFIDNLEANPDRIPGNRTIIIIPNINPDGYASSRRTNANNVDLNRNFPANDWKQGVTMPGGSYNPNGGGSAPLSEPESKALADYVLGQSPRLVLTYHAAAGVVIPNDSGDSDALAHAYDANSNVAYEPNSQTGTIFNYDTTGAFENWLHDKHDIATLLIELWTKTGSEYPKQRNALWYMVELP